MLALGTVNSPAKMAGTWLVHDRRGALPHEDLFRIMHGIIKFVPDIRKAENLSCLMFQLHSGEFFRVCINICLLPLLEDGRIVGPFCPYFLQTEDYIVCTLHERAHFQDPDNLRGLFSA